MSAVTPEPGALHATVRPVINVDGSSCLPLKKGGWRYVYPGQSPDLYFETEAEAMLHAQEACRQRRARIVAEKR